MRGWFKNGFGGEQNTNNKKPMTIKERAAKVLQEIDAALELAEKATAGPWTVEKYTNYHGYSVWGSGCCIAERWYKDAVTDDSAKEIAGDSAFIAASRTGWPTALRCLKTAITGLILSCCSHCDGSGVINHGGSGEGKENLEYCEVDCQGIFDEAHKALTTICNQWESK